MGTDEGEGTESDLVRMKLQSIKVDKGVLQFIEEILKLEEQNAHLAPNVRWREEYWKAIEKYARQADRST